MKITDIRELQEIAKRARKNILEQVYSAKSGHPGGALSCIDILTVLYFNQMNIDSENPKMEDRDRLVLSKGHSSAALYAILAEKGFFSVEELKEFRKLGSRLQGHPDLNKLPGVDMTTGSLGQGLSATCGMAMASKLKKQSNRVYCIVGDGEIQEGQIWEAAMTASQYKLDNLIAFIDYNGLQIDGKLSEVTTPEPIKEKFEAFGFDVFEIDGHNIELIIETVNNIKNNKNQKPNIVILKTIKGKGISFMENDFNYHGKKITEEEYLKAKQQLK